MQHLSPACMTERKSFPSWYSVVRFFATVCGLTQILFLADASFTRAKQFQESDYIMTFYVAGRLVAAGNASQLYPPPEAKTFVGAPFDQAAHALLDSLPAKTTAIYMYSPLLAWLLAPLSHLSASWSLLTWHILSLLALITSCAILSKPVKINFLDSVFLSSLYGPIFITLWSGQIGLLFGLLPLSAGYVLLIRGQPLCAGLVWSLLLLKPQYFPAAAFTALAVALCGSLRPALGIALGALGVAGANLWLFSPELVGRWLASHQLSDTLFVDAQYSVPAHLITSLPADILLLLPVALRPALKWPVYSIAMVPWLIGLYFAWKIYRAQWPPQTKISLILAIGCLLCSIALPHLLYYDLCVLIPVGFLFATTNDIVPTTFATKLFARLVWASISVYMMLFLLLVAHVTAVLLLEFILAVFLALLLIQVRRTQGATNAI